jgi:hypothetical protein
MMAKTAKNQITGYTPRAETKFFIDLPFIPKNANKPSYNIEIILDPDIPEHAEFISRLQKIQEAAYKQIMEMLPPARRKTVIPRFPLREDYDKEGNFTGKYVFKATSAYPPNLYDAHKNPIPYKRTDTGLMVFSPKRRAELKMKYAINLDPYDTGGNVGIKATVYAVKIYKLLENEFEDTFDDDDEIPEDAMSVEDILNEVGSIDTGFTPDTPGVDVEADF